MSLRNRKKEKPNFHYKQHSGELSSLVNGVCTASSDGENDSGQPGPKPCHPSDSPLPSSVSHPQHSVKRREIQDALRQRDRSKLESLSITQGGLFDDDLRCQVWPFFLDIDVKHIPKKPSEEELRRHRDYNQVVLDVNRSVKRFPPGMEESRRLEYQDQLIDCILWILVSNNDLHYYQGFHDVVVTFLLVVGEELTFAVIDKLCRKHFRDFMESTMDKTNEVLDYLLPIIHKVNPTLNAFLEKSEVGTIFCLPWLITWYGHVLKNFKDIVRLYDFFIACHHLMPIYLAAAMVLYRSEEVLLCECEMPYVHKLLSRIPHNLSFEVLIDRAGALFIYYPPSVLEHEAKLQRKKALEALKRKQEQDQLHMSLRRRRKPPQQPQPLGQHSYRNCIYGLISAAVGISALFYIKKNVSELCRDSFF